MQKLAHPFCGCTKSPTLKRRRSDKLHVTSSIVVMKPKSRRTESCNFHTLEHTDCRPNSPPPKKKKPYRTEQQRDIFWPVGTFLWRVATFNSWHKIFDRQAVKYPTDYMTGQILSPGQTLLVITRPISGSMRAGYFTGHRIEQP